MYKRILILYGSQTGVSQDLAEKIWRESKKYCFNGPVMAMDDYNIQELIEEKLVIFVCSTTGQGNEPDNMKKFWKFLLRKNLSRNSLDGCEFGVLGLGDSSYAKFNFVAKKLYKRLVQLSAKPLLPLGLCDDQHDLGPSAVYFNWIKDLWSNLQKERLILNGMTTKYRQFKWNVNEISENLSYKTDIELLKWHMKEEPYKMKLMGNERTTANDHFQDVRLITFDLGDAFWNPGDVLVLKPWNSDENVDKLFNIFAEKNLKFNKDTLVIVEKIDDEMPVPNYYEKPLKLDAVAKYLWDLTAIPRQRVFELLAINCIDNLEKEKLIEFTTPEGLDDLYTYVNRPRRTILEVLNDFPNAVSTLTIPILFELFPIIKAREFSIASSPKNDLLQILVAVVEYKTILSEKRKGLCSNWLKYLKTGDNIYGSIKSGTMKMPSNNQPVIMIGPGTGVAPFRSYILEKENNSIGEDLILFFGARSKSKDFHFKNDFERLEKNGTIKCFYAFSRDQDYKIYVQHRIEEQKELLRNLILNKNATILIAGNSKNMPTAVKEAFTNIVGDADYIENMVKQNRYQEETWS